VSALLGSADRLHGQPVAVSGTISNLREIVSHRGYYRYTFDLSDGAQMVRVAGYGTAPCRSGSVNIEGTFEQGKRAEAGFRYDKIIASRVVCVAEPSAKPR
jgi:hypothetical protein